MGFITLIGTGAEVDTDLAPTGKVTIRGFNVELDSIISALYEEWSADDIVASLNKMAEVEDLNLEFSYIDTDDDDPDEEEDEEEDDVEAERKKATDIESITF